MSTGSATKKDLKEIDERFSSQFSQQCDKILTVLDQLRDVIQSGDGRDLINNACEEWAKWIGSLDSSEVIGYSSVRTGEGASEEVLGVLLERVVDSETDLFQMLYALKSSLTVCLKYPQNIDLEMCRELSFGTREIMEIFQIRQKLLVKITGAKPSSKQ